MAMMTIQLLGNCGTGIPWPIKPAISGARMSPAIKATRQPISPLLGLSRPPKMPLMPAMRPVSSISRTEESPISPPPIAADNGVKLAMALLHQTRRSNLLCRG